VLELAEALRDHLERGLAIAIYPNRQDDTFVAFNQEMRFLTSKPVIYASNVGENGLAEDNEYVRVVREVAAEQDAEVVVVCAQLEADMAGMSHDERKEYLELAGALESGLEQIIRKAYRILGLISFFTMNDEQVRAWAVRQGWPAPMAAGVIHTDFERGFIRAEIVPFETFENHGGWSAAKSAGELRVEGKEYVVQDGDVIFFRFNV
jgi:hypothetical protein